jgi:hypothetical protein
MPYKLIQIKQGFKICKKDDEKKCFSKAPLTKSKAIKQMKALYIHTK